MICFVEMRLSIEINGVESKFTCFSSMAIVVFALLLIIGTVVVCANGLRSYSAVIDAALIM